MDHLQPAFSRTGEIKTRYRERKKSDEYRFKFGGELWRKKLSGLSLSARCVWLSLRLHANDQTGECYPGHRGIAKELGVSNMRVLRALKELEAKKVFRVVRRPGAVSHRFLSFL